ARRAVASIATIGLYLTLVLYGNWILMGVVEEKTSRVVEVLLGLLQPTDLLAGKTLGILASALVQLAFGIAGGVAALVYVGTSVLPGATLDVVAASIAYLLPGVVLYSLLYAAVGATVSRQSEAQSAAMPVSFFLLVPYMLGLTIVPGSPDGGIAQVLSILPLTSPLIMPTRIAMGSPSVFEVALSYALLWPAILGVAWLGGNIYASAILMNRSVKLAQLLRLLRHGEGGRGATAT
ncbi:MAG TPA: ABC transporter permease, partial [Dehalococcoidia bacterium]|nr:ABC transporter permease [Dehalococcoidia bacterium]